MTTQGKQELNSFRPQFMVLAWTDLTVIVKSLCFLYTKTLINKMDT